MLHPRKVPKFPGRRYCSWHFNLLILFYAAPDFFGCLPYFTFYIVTLSLIRCSSFVSLSYSEILSKKALLRQTVATYGTGSYRTVAIFGQDFRDEIALKFVLRQEHHLSP